MVEITPGMSDERIADVVDRGARLRKLTSEQVAKYWDLIRETLYESFVPEAELSEGMLTEIFAKLMSGDMQAWFSMAAVAQESRKSYSLQGIILTVIRNEPCAGTRHLLVYSAKGFQTVSAVGLRQAWEELKEFGKQNNCERLVSYTSRDRTANIMQMLGGEEVSRVFVWEL